MKFCLSILVIIATFLPCAIIAQDTEFSVETCPTQTFLDWARKQPVQENWGKLSGAIIHKRTGESMLERKVYLAMRATPKRVFSQLIIGDSELYTVSQAFEAKEGSTSVDAKNPDSQKELPRFGVKPDDLTFSFLYWDLVKEFPQETIRLQKCRILELQSPKKEERVKIWIATSYGLPIRVEWYKKDETTYYRALEIEDVAQLENKLWVISRLSVSGKGWRTQIKFTERDAGKVADGIPTQLFKVIP